MCWFNNVLEGKVIRRKIRVCITVLGVLFQKWIGGAVNLMRNDGTGSQCLECWFKNGLEGQVI